MATLLLLRAVMRSVPLRQAAAEIEPCAIASWPAREVLRWGGWILRFADGFTHRANSVATLDFDGVEVEGQIGIVEAEYLRRGLSPMFQITPATQPTALESLLLARGYERRAETCVCLAAPAAVSERLPRPGDVRRTSAPDTAWSALVMGEARSEGDGRERMDILSRIDLPLVCAASFDQGVVVAVGTGTLCDGRVGINLMRTAGAHRRKGHAQRVLASIADWAMAQGASTLYLGVESDNAPARVLYTRAGFETVYSYRYLRHAADDHERVTNLT
jgi:GNAT superfamily N-acetyltransferase